MEVLEPGSRGRPADPKVPGYFLSQHCHHSSACLLCSQNKHSSICFAHLERRLWRVSKMEINMCRVPVICKVLDISMPLCCFNLLSKHTEHVPWAMHSPFYKVEYCRTWTRCKVFPEWRPGPSEASRQQTKWICNIYNILESGAC